MLLERATGLGMRVQRVNSQGSRGKQSLRGSKVNRVDKADVVGRCGRRRPDVLTENKSTVVTVDENDRFF